MDTRAPGGDIEVSPSAAAGRPEVEVRREEPPVVVADPARSWRPILLVIAIVLALLLAGLGALWLLRGGDDDVATVPAAGKAGPAEPAALTVQVDPPATAVAGSPVTLVVHYADGHGVFSGSTEDWGDGVGVGSAKNGSCSTAPAPGPVNGSYRATHTWAEPGTYPVAIEVTTYVCQGSSVVEENATATLDVTVTAP